LDDQVSIGGGRNDPYHYRTEEELRDPIGPPPEFPEPIESVRARIAAILGHVTVSHKVVNWYPAIDRLVKEDEKRREKQLTASYVMSWDKPLFGSH
jgi:hypothetical protein